MLPMNVRCLQHMLWTARLKHEDATPQAPNMTVWMFAQTSSCVRTRVNGTAEGEPISSAAARFMERRMWLFVFALGAMLICWAELLASAELHFVRTYSATNRAALARGAQQRQTEQEW
jgi:hypothetical protein